MTESSSNPFPEAIVLTHRPAYTHANFEAKYPRNEPQKLPISERLRSKFQCSGACMKRSLLGKLPFIQTVRTYKLKKWLLNDIIAGISVGVVHIPMGMGFSLLMSLPPVYGLYTSLFPSIVYFFLGTSNHISMGTMSLTSLMISGIIEREVLSLGLPDEERVIASDHTSNDSALTLYLTNSTKNVINVLTNTTSDTNIPDFDLDAFKVDIATSVTLLMGLWQVGLSLLNLGVLGTFMATAFIGGFLTGAAGHIVTSQIPAALGIKIEKAYGTFGLPLTWYEIVKNLPSVNPADIIISIICLTFLIVIKEVINNRFSHRMKVPIPAEIILVVIATIISHFCKLTESFEVKIVGHLPKGLPSPKIPSMYHAENYLMDSFFIALISFVLTISMAKMFGRKHGYHVDQNQEMFASGAAFGISAFFQCYGGAQAPPRTLIQESTGGKTQVASLFSSLLVLLVCLFLAPAFQSLPKSVLACIIIVAVLPLFKQFGDMKNFWILNKYDFFIWIITWLASSILSITLGLVVGIGFSLLTIVINAFFTPVFKMEKVNADIYKQNGMYVGDGKMEDRIRIVRFEAPLFFANLDRFKAKVWKECGFDLEAAKETNELQKNDNILPNNNDAVLDDNDEVDENIQLKIDANSTGLGTTCTNDTPVVILDCSAISYIDIQGLNMLKQIQGDFKDADVMFVLAGCSGTMLNKLDKMGFLGLNKESVFLSVHDAVAKLSHSN